jgi:hypothetical protein
MLTCVYRVSGVVTVLGIVGVPGTVLCAVSRDAICSIDSDCNVTWKKSMLIVKNPSKSLVYLKLFLRPLHFFLLVASIPELVWWKRKLHNWKGIKRYNLVTGAGADPKIARELNAHDAQHEHEQWMNMNMNMTHDTWHMTHDTWHMTHEHEHEHDTWHMTHDTWHMNMTHEHDTWTWSHTTWHVHDMHMICLCSIISHMPLTLRFDLIRFLFPLLSPYDR